MSKIKCQASGFSLLEVLIVIAILSVLAVAGAGFYRSFIKSAEIGLVAKNIISDLKDARAKSMVGENGLKWGVHFINGNEDYYEIFSTPADYSSASTTIDETDYLPGAIYFTSPANLSSSTVIFGKINGTTTATTTIGISSSEEEVKTITITPIGTIY